MTASTPFLKKCDRVARGLVAPILFSALLAFLVACAPQQSLTSTPTSSAAPQPPEESFVSEGCMRHVRALPEDEVPPPVAFIRNLVSDVFACEYYVGGPIRIYGMKVSIKNNVLRNAYGYAIMDRLTPLSSFLTVADLPERYSYQGNNAKLKVVRATYAFPGLLGVFPTYYVYVETRISLPQRIAALSIIDFSEGRSNYRLVLWVQEYPLSKALIVERFRAMRSGIIAPEVETVLR